MIILLPKQEEKQIEKRIEIDVLAKEEEVLELPKLSIEIKKLLYEEKPKLEVVVKLELEKELPKTVEIDTPPVKVVKERNVESVLESILTGSRVYYSECKLPKYYTPLFKENFLNEFLSEEDKNIVKTNLGIYTEDKINNIINLLLENSGFVTNDLLNLAIDKIKFVDSKNKGKINYDISDKLFKL